MLGQHAPHQVFVHGDIEGQVHLIGNPLVAEAWVPSLHFHDGGNQLGRRALWPGSSAPFWGEQLPVLTLHEQSLKAQYRGGFQNDRTTTYAPVPSSLHIDPRPLGSVDADPALGAGNE